MKGRKFTTVDDYFKEIPKAALERMATIRKELKTVAPLASEAISYNMPALKYKGVLVYYAAYEKHIGFYAIPNTHEHFAKELAGYKQGKGSVQFPHDRPLPMELIKRMMAYRYQQQLEANKS
ncbi:DUF1801 domain-containing protein [Flagellimonas taeanensis]|uniref:iron chaperone n=1 Tax=Flavobacteriaceae TaxID=49546 RepID=UPI000E687D86|nr:MULTISPECIES: DUF1801 domain-containing protein [Allomuricauda]MDC6385829.1 DUF1801 domain-containing protein [Muricauda sp. SK9]RIV50876.1 DUF1801 domain-containing protein [Allomuricauda taeanensis]